MIALFLLAAAAAIAAAIWILWDVRVGGDESMTFYPGKLGADLKLSARQIYFGSYSQLVLRSTKEGTLVASVPVWEGERSGQTEERQLLPEQLPQILDRLEIRRVPRRGVVVSVRELPCRDEDFIHHPIHENGPSYCTPIVDPGWEGMRIHAPSAPLRSPPDTTRWPLRMTAPIVGVVNLSDAQYRALTPDTAMTVVIVDGAGKSQSITRFELQEREAMVSGPFNLHRPMPPERQARDRSEAFAIDIGGFLAAPSGSTEFVVHVEYGPLRSNDVRIHVTANERAAP